MVAPQKAVPSNLVWGESSGITIVASRPVILAAAATACRPCRAFGRAGAGANCGAGASAGAGGGRNAATRSRRGVTAAENWLSLGRGGPGQTRSDPAGAGAGTDSSGTKLR